MSSVGITLSVTVTLLRTVFPVFSTSKVIVSGCAGSIITPGTVFASSPLIDLMMVIEGFAV